MLSIARKIGRSIFFKLVLVFIVTAVALVIAVGAVIRYFADEPSRRGLIGRNLTQYSQYIAEQIGSPPDLEAARRLTESLQFGLAIRTPYVDWSSSAREFDRMPDALRKVEGFPNAVMGRERGRLFIKIERPAAEYLFVYGRRGAWREQDYGPVLLLVPVVIALILTLSYLVVRWLLKPLRWLTGGMKQMAGGHLGTTIPVRKYDELGEVARTFNDMSERIRDLVRAKEQLLLDVSHELRSPMTRMKLSAEFIDSDKIRERIVADLHEMEAMTAEILETERLASEQGGLTLETVDLAALLEELASGYEKRPPGVRMSAGVGPVPVRADRERIRMAFRNLLDNAVKYSERQERPVEVALRTGSGRVAVTVKDYGDGIPQQEQSLIFEPFYRVDKSRHRKTGGYGLGLSLSRKIVEAHGGSVSLRSSPGQGSEFTVELPNAG